MASRQNHLPGLPRHGSVPTFTAVSHLDPHSQISLQSIYRKPVRRAVFRFSRRPQYNPLPMTTARLLCAQSLFGSTFHTPAQCVVFVQSCNEDRAARVNSPAASPIPRPQKSKVRSTVGTRASIRDSAKRKSRADTAFGKSAQKAKDDPWADFAAWT